MQQHLTFVGSTRFSVVNAESCKFNEFKGRSTTIGDVRAAIFNEKRLTNRFAMFENIVLPSLVGLAETQVDFHHVLLLSAELPQKWRQRLESHAARHQWLHLREVPFESTISSVNAQFIAGLSVKHRLYNFRLDDDDALAARYCSEVENAARSLQDGTIIACEKGFRLCRLPTGRFLISAKRRKSPSAGLGVLSAPNQLLEIYSQGNHKRVAVSKIANNRPMWLRLIHSSNDSDAGVGHWWSWRHTTRSASRMMQTHFPAIDLEQALPHVPVLAD